jgi:hypothetical protein
MRTQSWLKENSIKAARELAPNRLGTVWEPFGNRLGTVWEPFGNRLGTVWEPFGNTSASGSRSILPCPAQRPCTC